MLYLVCFSTISTAQKFEGIATYKTDISINSAKSSMEGVDEATIPQILEQMKAQFRKEFTLTFTSTASIYKEVEKLDTPRAPNDSGITISVSGGNDLVYRNFETNKYVNETEIIGKEFLVEDQLETSEWKLEKESKNIGQYLCFKATKTKIISEKKFDSNSNRFEDSEIERITTVWFTPSIPLPHGPDEYYGLPGLVLEVNDGEVTILCSKITLNPKEGVVIEKPNNGKIVDQKTYNDIQKKKSEEMMERFQSSGRKNENNKQLFRIKTGG